MTPTVFNSFSQKVKHSTFLNLLLQPFQKKLPVPWPSPFLKFVPGFRLCSPQKVKEHFRVQAKFPVIILRLPLQIPIFKQAPLNALFKIPFRRIDYATSSRTSIFPVTAAEIRAVRYSFSFSICALILFINVSIFSVSLLRLW